MTDITDDDILMLALNELEPARAAAVEAALRADPARAASAAKLRAAMAAVTPTDAPGASDDFTDRVCDAIRRDHHHGGEHRRRWRLGLSSLAAAAAVGLVVVLLPTLGPRPAAAAVAWADVVKAMGNIHAIHAMIYWHGPDRNLPDRVTREDVFYRRPGMWRGHGRGFVHFLRDGNEKLYSVEQRQFVDPATVLIKPLNVPEQSRFKDGPVLDSILDMLFKGEAPQPTPVDAESAEIGKDIQLFEYRGTVSKPQTTVRIAVAVASRLPVRIDLIEGNDAPVISVYLEYAAPLPAESFDAEAFARAVEERKLTRPADIFRIGLPGELPSR